MGSDRKKHKRSSPLPEDELKSKRHKIKTDEHKSHKSKRHSTQEIKRFFLPPAPAMANKVLKHHHYLPEEIVEMVIHYVTSNKDRNAVSLVCKLWYKLESLSRDKVVIKNCNATSPERVITRFPRLTSLTLKGMPDHDSFALNIIPDHLDDSLHSWILTMVGKVNLEQLRVKRMVVRDETLILLSEAFPDFKSLVLISCRINSTDGLAAIASNCRSLKELDFQESAFSVKRRHLLCSFPDSCTTLVSLNFACLPGIVDTEALERLVARCPNLTSLRLNHSVTLDVLLRILVQAPQLVDLGVGSCYIQAYADYSRLKDALYKCTSIRSLSGFMTTVDRYLLWAFYRIFQRLTSLKLTLSPIRPREFEQLIRICPKLKCLWVPSTGIDDEGLTAVASTCKELQELWILPRVQAFVTDKGLVAVSDGCPKLKSLMYTCIEITNEALRIVAKNRPNLVSFILHAQNRKIADAKTMLPLDEGFGAIVLSCKGLKRLRLCGFLTDRVVIYIGMDGQQLEKLTIPFAGDSDRGILYVLNGCKKLKELDISNSRFGNGALLADVRKYETMRSLCVTSCQVTLEACKELAQEMPRLNVEIIGKRWEPGHNVVVGDNIIKRMYVYRTLVGPRKDASVYVWTL